MTTGQQSRRISQGGWDEMVGEGMMFPELFEAEYRPRVAQIGQRVRVKNDSDTEPSEMDILDLLMLKNVARALGFWNEVEEDGDLQGVARTFAAANRPITPEQLQAVIALAQRALEAKQPPTCLQFAQALGRTVLIQVRGPSPPLHPVERNQSDWWELKGT